MCWQLFHTHKKRVQGVLQKEGCLALSCHKRTWVCVCVWERFHCAFYYDFPREEDSPSTHTAFSLLVAFSGASLAQFDGRRPTRAARAQLRPTLFADWPRVLICARHVSRCVRRLVLSPRDFWRAAASEG